MEKFPREQFQMPVYLQMESLNDNFEACTWYRDHWIDDRIILRGAKG